MILKKRSEFVVVSQKGNRVNTKGLILQARKRAEGENDCHEDLVRFGFTVTKQSGNSVERNRIRRRLRNIAKESIDIAKPGYDYVVVGKRTALEREYEDLRKDLRYAIHNVV